MVSIVVNFFILPHEDLIHHHAIRQHSMRRAAAREKTNFDVPDSKWNDADLSDQNR